MTMRILCLRLRLRPDDEPSGRERTSAFHVVPDAALRARLADDIEEFSPLIGWLGAGGSASLCLDVGPTAHGFGGEAALLECVRAWTDRRRLLCTAALADTIGAAWGTAHYGFGDEPAAWRCRVVPPGRQAAALATLPVAALRLSFGSTALLQELGFSHIGPLFSLPRTALAERFPPELLLRIDQALGKAPELFAAHRPPPLWEARLGWEGNVTSVEPLVAAWRHLLPQLLGPLHQRGHGIVRLLAEQTGESRTLRRLVARQQSSKMEAECAAETDACVATTAVEAEAELRRLEAMDKAHVVSFEVNDKFNLPPIVALTIAVAYILLGVVIYRQWERWTYLEAFYFVFISLSTVGFGDILPEHPNFFLASSVYVLIGLALVAMVITVVMETVNSTIEIAKDKVCLVGRRIADVAQMQTERLAHHHPGAMFKDLQRTVAVQGLVFKPKQFRVFKPKHFQRRCSV